MSESSPKFSLVLATIGRTSELRHFLKCLFEQTYRHIQLIVVDQNSDDRVTRLLDEGHPDFEIIHERSKPGLSRARNVGLGRVSGDIVGFPDDDCWYGPRLLEQIRDIMLKTPNLSGVSGTSSSEDGSVGGRFSTRPGPITLSDVWMKGISYSIFLKADLCRAIGGFDETLGVGAGTPFGSGEETDYLIRALRLGAELAFRPDVVVYHPNKTLFVDEKTIKSAYHYGVGMGYVLKKHGYSLSYRLESLARPVAGSAWAALLLDFPMSRLRLSRARGRLSGMLKSASAVTKEAQGR